MNSSHFVQIGNYFSSVPSTSLMSNQNLNEFDFIIINSNKLLDDLRFHTFADWEKRLQDLKEYHASKKMPVVIMMSDSYSVHLPSGIKHISDLFKLDLTLRADVGKRIEIRNGNHFSDFFKQNINSIKYKVSFSKHPGNSIASPIGKSNVSVSFFTNEYVFIPEINKTNPQEESKFLLDLYQLCKSLPKEKVSLNIPDWTNSYYLPNEKEDFEQLNEINNRIKVLNTQKEEQESKLEQYKKNKMLWTSHGSVLELKVKEAFEELGFVIIESVVNRDDILMKWGEQIIVVEIKGLTKSAQEKNSAQLEKWKMEYVIEHGIEPKGLLIVNTYRDQPLNERKENSFPDQMLKFAKAKEQCLLTTVQLCCLLFYIRENPNSKEELINKMLSHIGVFDRFNNWEEIINLNNN